MTDAAAPVPVLSIASAETSVAGASASVALPATVWHLLGATDAGRVFIQGSGVELPPHRLAVLLGRVSASGAVDQHQTATLFLTRPTEDAETEEPPPFCGHPGNAEYGDDDQPGGGGGGGDGDGPGQEDPDDDNDDDTDASDAAHPGDEPGAATPVSSEDCETEEGTEEETEEETEEGEETQP